MHWQVVSFKGDEFPRLIACAVACAAAVVVGILTEGAGLTETNQVDFPDTYCVPRRLLLLKCFGLKVELEEAVRKGNEKFNTMITDQLMAQEDIRRAAEMEAKVKAHTPYGRKGYSEEQRVSWCGRGTRYGARISPYH